MERVTHATKATDLFGSGKHGYTDGVPAVTPATVLNSAAMNSVQEELANAVEMSGFTLDSGDDTQLYQVMVANVADSLTATAATTLTLRGSGGYTSDFNGCCFAVTNGGDRTWVVVGVDKIMYSWNNAHDFRSASGVAAAGIFRGVCYSAVNSLFVAVGGTGASPIIYTSPTGASWTSRSPGGSPGGYLAAIVEAESTLVAVGSAGEIQTSANGTAWTKRTAAASHGLNAITHDGTTFVAGANSAGTGVIHTSANGTTGWTTHSMPADSGGVTGLVYGNSELVAVGVKASDTSVGRVYYSTNSGSTWTLRIELGEYVPLGLTYANSRYMVCTDSSTDTAFGGHPAVMTSKADTSAAWTAGHAASAQEVAGSAGGTLWALCTDGKKILTAGSFGTIADSAQFA